MGIIILISPGWGEEGVWHLANPHSVNGVAITMLLTMLPFKVFFFFKYDRVRERPTGNRFGGAGGEDQEHQSIPKHQAQNQAQESVKG